MIKKTFCLLVIASLTLTFSCKKNDSKDGTEATNSDGKFAKMDFVETEHDFGTIKQGDKVATDFVFTNNGEADLLITEAKGSCGCTIPDYPKTPVKPGDKGTIKVSFNSTGKSGQQHKTVTIRANTKTGSETLNITASITPRVGIAQ